MATPIAIQYCQSAFTLPWDSNRQRIHDVVYDTLLESKHIPEGQRTRDFVYDVTLIDQSSELAMATARSPQFRDSVPAENCKIVVRAGDQLSIRAKLSAVRRSKVVSGDGSPAKEQYEPVPATDIPEWTAQLLARHGMSVSDVQLKGYVRHRVAKPKLSFNLNVAHIESRVTIEDPAVFAKAFLQGVGRNKGYGLGMLEVVDSASA